MPESSLPLQTDEELRPREPDESPLHGFRGHPGTSVRHHAPAALSIALSREAGSRGAAIARRAGAKLGWQVYSQDLLEYICHEGTFRQEVLANLPAEAGDWVETEIRRLQAQQAVADNTLDLARMVLSLGAQGEVVLLGRGAGCILPSRSTLNVRLVAPLADRIAYIAQWMRLTEEEATEQVSKSDQRRADYIQSHFHRKPGDVHQYDLVLNTSLMGEERCAEVIVHAAKSKMAN